ncbi:MAG: hypothetical protein B5M53_08860 [Candidatus Cloacimonas sp. 4484_209]|nr:MAG: hypothetical protein B5M53_08860 [Candidatus Cloacimonas sp. 4484_209]
MSNERSVSLYAVGDIALGDHPLTVGHGVASKLKEHGPLYPFEYARHHFRNADIVFGNLEYAMFKLKKSGTLSTLQTRGEECCVKGLKWAGFNVLNLANNHIQQHGKNALINTINLLGKNCISSCGISSKGSKYYSQPTTIEKNSICLGFLGYSLRPRQYFKDKPLYCEGNKKIIISDVTQLKKDVNHVIVSLHWGDEFIDHPSPSEIRLAHDIIDAGASIILGHHPHVLRGIEHYNNSLIIYSMGNFVGDMLWENRMRQTMIVSININNDRIGDTAIIPMYINDNYQPAPCPPQYERQIRRKIAKLSLELEKIDIEPIDNNAKDYTVAVKKELLKNKLNSRIYFLRNIFNYSSPILIQQLKRFILSRLPID